MHEPPAQQHQPPQRPPKEPYAVRHARHMAERQAAENARRARHGKRPLGEPRPLWQRRQRLGWWGVLLGALAVIGAVAIDYGWYSKPVSEINGVCSTQLGLLFAAGHPKVAARCSHAALLDHAVGWLIIAGVVAIVAGAAAIISARHLRSGVAQPAVPPTAG